MVVLLGPTVLVVLSSHMAKYILLSIQQSMKCYFVKNLKIKHLFFLLISLLELELQSYYSERYVCYFLYKEGLSTRFIYLFIWPCEAVVCVAPLSKCREPTIKRIVKMIIIMIIIEMMVMMMMIYILCWYGLCLFVCHVLSSSNFFPISIFSSFFSSIFCKLFPIPNFLQLFPHFFQLFLNSFQLFPNVF